MITPLAYTFETLPTYLSKYIPKIISEFTLSPKIQDIAISCFKISTSLYLGAFGTFELFQKNIQVDSSNKSEIGETILKRIQSSSSAYLGKHGGLMAGSGVFGFFEALNSFGLIDIGTANVANALGAASNILFIGANIIALEENLRLYNEIKETDWSVTNIDKEELRWIEQSALWGIFSNIGYIVATVSLVYSGMTAFALVMAALSCFAGGVKILYDLSLWVKEKG